MKISAGSLKGRNIKFSYRKKPRPTTSLVRRALFNILGARLEGSVFLDVFAGSGIVGLEAFSNGAGQIFFIEKDPLLVNSLRHNVSRLKVNAVVLAGDYRRCLRQLGRKKNSYDFIYIDPPYAGKCLLEALHLCQRYHLLKEKGMFITEHNKKSNEINTQWVKDNNLTCLEKRAYGMTMLNFLIYGK